MCDYPLYLKFIFFFYIFAENGHFVTATEVNGMQDVKDVEVHLKRTAEEKRRKETLKFMKGVMDEITHLRNYSIPVDPTAVTFVIAKDDAYFPQSSLENMKDVWPGCEVKSALLHSSYTFRLKIQLSVVFSCIRNYACYNLFYIRLRLFFSKVDF